MQIHALAVDYDGTLAHDGLVDQATIEALEKIVATGRRIVLVTGRRLEPLKELMPNLKLFSLVVAENGALLYDPATTEVQLLSEAVPPQFIDRLVELGVDRLESGKTIVATWRPFETQCLQVIQELALDLQIVFNKDAVMVLPTGINKAAGLKSALELLAISPLNTLAVGDAENDLAMFKLAGVSAAVSNALDSVMDAADLKLSRARGDGVQELAQLIINDDLKAHSPFPKHRLRLGSLGDNNWLEIPVLGESIMVVGGSGGGKSKFGLAFLEELTRLGAQSIILDPEGDYQSVENSIVLGTGNRAPELEELVRMLDKNSGHFVVSIFRVPEEERPYYFDQLLHKVSATRGDKGRPHWLIVDEAHYVAPSQWRPAENWSDYQLTGTLLISAFPEKLSAAVLDSMRSFVFIGESPQVIAQEYRKLSGEEAVELQLPEAEHPSGYGLYWRRADDQPIWFYRMQAANDSQRHQHSYFDGEMDPEYRFVFRGPEHKLNLEVQNLKLFMQIGQGVDDATWEYHLRNQEFPEWFSWVIKSAELSDVASSAERNSRLTAAESRKLIFTKIRELFEPHG